MKFEGMEILKNQQEDFYGIKWVLRALSKNSHLIVYDYIFFEDGYCIGTDGHRMHIYEYVGKYENGAYEKILNNTGKIILKFIPNQKYLDWLSINTTSMKPLEIKFLPDLSSIPYTKVIRNMDPSVTIQFSYFDNLVRSTWTKWTAYIYDKTDGVWFMTDRRIALIMPMHVV